MAELVGKNLYMIWCYTGGSTVLSTDFRAFSMPDETGEVDKSAGADLRRTYIPNLIDGQLTTSYLHDGGTTNWSILKPGTEGTVIWGEAGTANGAPKHTMAVFIKSNNFDAPYDGLEIWNPVFRPMGDRTDGTWSGGF